MQFKTGWLGACLVVIALLATVLLGFTLNINEGIASVLKYDPITNVTGQFEGDAVPEYIEYNGAKNYTGYTGGTIGYTSSSVANQYTVIADPGIDTDLGQVDINVVPYYTGSTLLDNKIDFIGVNGGLWLTAGRQITVNQFLTNANIDYTDYDYLKIDLLGHSTLWSTDGYYYSDNLVTASTVPKSDFTTYVYGTELKFRLNSYTVQNITYNLIHWTDGQYLPYSTDNNNIASYLIVYKDGSVNHYRSGTGISGPNNTTITVTDELVFSSDVGNTYINWLNYAGSIVDSSAHPFPGNITLTDPMKNYRNVMNGGAHYSSEYLYLNGVENVVYDYMRISDGVTLTAPSEWNNGRENGVIDWVIKFNAGDTINITPAWGGITHGTVTLSYDGASMSASVAGTAYNGGGWNTWHISIDGLNGSVALTPVTSFNTFQNYTLSASPKVFNVPAFAHGGITSVNLSATGTPNFSVTRTTVNYDISKTSVLNGSMNPRQYFPIADYGQLKITFDSFAVFGDGVTLNGVTYPVQDRSITIGAYNFQLNGLSVVYNSDNTMTVENDKISADLGEIVDNTITFNGIWYFTARALNGFYTNVPTVEWDIGTWATTFNQTIVLYEAILLIGGLVARHYQKIKALDWVIIIFAMVGGAVLV